MKKRLLLTVVTGLSVLALAGCGKTPTLEDIKANISDKAPTTGEGTMEITASGEATINDPSDDMEEMLDMVDQYYGIDLTDGVDLEISANFEFTGERNDDYSHSVITGSLEADSSVDEIADLIEEELTGEDTEYESESYTDFEEEIKYVYDDGEWYYEDYDEDDDEDEVKLMESFLDYCIAHNENADKDEQIVIKAEKDKYVLDYEITIDNDFVANVDKSEKKALQSLLDDVEIEIDLDEVFDLIEEYGDYADISIPFSLNVAFVNVGDKKNPEYAISSLDCSFGGTISGDWDEDQVEEIFEAMDEEMPDGVSFGLEFSIEASIKVSATLSYDDDADVEIPKKVTKDAVSYEDHAWGTSGSSYEYDDDDYEYEEDDYSVYEEEEEATEAEVEANADGSYTLYNYFGDKVANFYVPDGFTVSDYSTTTSYSLNDDNYTYIYITSYVTSGIAGYYQDDPSEYVMESMEEYEKIKSVGDFDIYYNADYEQMYAVADVNGDENEGFVIEAYISSYSTFEDKDDFIDFIEDNF